MCSDAYEFLQIFGVTQHPETNECMIVMQYANNGSLPSYLDKNINKLTWKMKLQYLKEIAGKLRNIHWRKLIHCDIHGGNIVLNNEQNDTNIQPLICDLGLSKSVNSSQSTATIQGVLPYI